MLQRIQAQRVNAFGKSRKFQRKHGEGRILSPLLKSLGEPVGEDDSTSSEESSAGGADEGRGTRSGGASNRKSGEKGSRKGAAASKNGVGSSTGDDVTRRKRGKDRSASSVRQRKSAPKNPLDDFKL